MQEYRGQELGENLEEKLELSVEEKVKPKSPPRSMGGDFILAVGSRLLQHAVPGWKQGGRGHPQPGPR